MASRNSMLEKILEDFPNCNNQSINQVKNETPNRDSNDLFSNSNFLDHSKSYTYNNRLLAFSQINFTSSTYSTSALNNQMNSHLNLPNTTSFFNNDQSYSTNSFSNYSTSPIDRNKMKNINCQPNKSQINSKNEIVDPIDLTSLKGKFGWSRCKVIDKEIPLPIILRRDDKLVPVRIVETKIIGLYSNDLPWNVFSCINMKSFSITLDEAKLLNEINNLHCDGYYGSEGFLPKDIVVRLNDVQELQMFLETSKKVFLYGLDGCDFLGFVQISGIASVIPYIIKESFKSNNQDITQNKSMITPSLSNLSIKNKVVDQKDKIDHSLHTSNNSKKLKSDNSSFTMNKQDNLNSANIDSTSDINNENNSNDFNDSNFENHLEQDFNNQVTSSSNYAEQSTLNQDVDQTNKNNFINLVNDLDHNVNNFETDRPDQVLGCDTNHSNYRDSNDQLKATTHSKKFVPYSLVEDISSIERAEKIDLSEWDCSYLKMICIYAGFDNLTKSLTMISKSLANANNNGNSINNNSNSLKLVCLNDLKCGAVYFKPVTAKECMVNSSFNPSPTQFNQVVANQSHQHSIVNNYLTTSNVQTTTNLSHNKSHHHFNQHHPTTHQVSSHLHPHSKKLNTNNNHQLTKEVHSLSYLDDLFHKISPTNNSFANDNLIDQTTSNSNNSLNLHLSGGCNTSNMNNNLNSNNPYQSASNYSYNIRSHLDNYSSHTQLNSQHQPITHQPTIGNLQSTTNKSNYHLNTNNKSNNFSTSSSIASSNQSNKTNHLFGSTIIDELAKNFRSNGTTTNINSLNNLNSTINNRNVQNNYNCNSANSNQSNLATTSNFNFNNSATNNSNISNNNDLTSNRMSNLSMINLGLSNPFQNTSHTGYPYTVSSILFENVQLKSINLKPSTLLQSLLLSEICQKLLNGINMTTFKLIIENSFNLKLYDCSSLHKHAFNNHGIYPSQDDKLILIDDLKKILPQIRQSIANLMNLMPNKS